MKTKKNILYTTSFSHMSGGGQWSLYYLIKYLKKDIFHPIVLCPAEGELALKMRGIGAEVVFFDVGRIRYLNPLVIRKFIALIRERQIALIHTDSSTETFYGGIAARMMKIPLIWHVRVNEQEWFLDRMLSLLSTKLIIVANALSRRFAWLENRQKIVVIYNGIDLAAFDHFPDTVSIRAECNIPKDTAIIGCIGRIEKQKGQDYLISAMRNIANVTLIIIGRGEKEYIRHIQSLCNEFNISDRVIHLDHRDDIPSLIKEIDILVFPTLTEGFSRIILEAMAARKSVVATNTGGNAEAIDDGITGYIVPPRDVASLAAKIKLLVADKRKRSAMGQAGRKRVEELFTIEKNVERIQAVYKDILEIT